ncbi:hypothetical protein FJ937_16440 [Mesorhizobium sp. B2-4-4]|uniref:hypothetical protein n=1 Tax=Mesorhizobium sp. B2-4-4 TaxID=2589945 RepID=UPI0011279E44|nr:hypothetical protein [Mesorhizobium sp. B2-4-4]TPL49073.1 hypothetical protein FJ937_16440 [Mesorhizobium sp. B2-4-4]
MRSIKLDQITLCADGSIGLKLLKIISDGDNIISSEPHRMPIMPDQSAEEIAASLNSNLEEMGFPPLPSAEFARVDAIAVPHRQAESVAADIEEYKQKKAEAAAAWQREEAARQAAAAEQEQADIAAAKAEQERFEKMVADAVAAQLGERATDPLPIE